MNPSPSLTLDYEKSSFLANAVFGEVINIDCLNALIGSEFLQENYDVNNYSSKLASQYYQNEKEQLTAYKRLYNKKELIVPVKYGLPRHTLGRVSPFRALGLTGFSRRIRNTLIKDNYRDLDLSNAQPYILYNICKNNNMAEDCHFLDQLIHEREQILENVMTTYNVSRKKAKQLFLRLAFYGTFDGWVKENGLDSNFKPNNFIVGLTTELQNIATKVKVANKALYEKVRKINHNKTNLLGSFMAFYLQTYELHILNVICEYLCNETTLCNIQTSKVKILTYEYDGIKLLKSNVDGYGTDKLCRDLERIVLDKTGFIIVLEEKQIDDCYDIQFEPNNDVNNDETSYDYMKTEFELHHAKIINKSIFIKEQNNKIFFLKKEELKTAYEHLSFEEPIYDKDGSVKCMKTKSFVTEWLKDKNMRKYEDMGVFPPPLNCPNNIFNMWLPFSMELIDDYTIDKFTLDGFDAIIDHIKLLCGFNDDVYDYFIKWLAQMVQYPAIKTICPTLISGEGAGKGTLITGIIQRMFGSHLLLETTDPMRDAFGAFNELMVGKFFVNLNEVSKKDTTEAIGKIKGLITDGNLIINPKGLKKFPINSFHRFIISTNSEDPITSKKGDRRNWIIRSSDKRCGDKEYFKTLNEYIENINVIKMFYEFLKSIPDMKDFGLLTMPITEYQESLQQQSVCPIEQWLKHFCMIYKDKESIEMLGLETYNLFHNWCITNNIKYDCNSTNLLTKICLLQTSGKITGIENGKHTNKGNTKIFNITKLKKHFGIGCLIDFKSQIEPDDEE